MFTVPLSACKETVERAYLRNGKLVYLEKAQYHDDHIRGQRTVLCYRDYGLDIVKRLSQAGFSKAEIISVQAPTSWGFDNQVVVAYK